MNEGQFFLTDFTSSAVFFSIFILSFGITWSSATEKFTKDSGFQEDQSKYTFNLLKTQGQPENWTADTVVFPGLYSGKFLDERKFLQFKQLPEGKKSRLLKSNNFNLDITYMNGSTAVYNRSLMEVSSGSIPDTTSVFVERSIVVLKYQKLRANMKYYTWQ